MSDELNIHIYVSLCAKTVEIIGHEGYAEALLDPDSWQTLTLNT